jgi:hypothetical protein
VFQVHLLGVHEGNAAQGSNGLRTSPGCDEATRPCGPEDWRPWRYWKCTLADGGAVWGP